MHEFLVTVSCLVGLSCPLPDQKPMTSSFKAKDARECKAKVSDLIAHFNYEPKKFIIICDPRTRQE